MNRICFLFLFGLCLILTACGGKNVKTQPQPVVAPAVTPAVTPAVMPTQPTPSQPPEKGRGGYYLDDGPGENPPANIDAIPDAVPESEVLAPRANSPYTVFGKRYVPMPGYVPYKDSGIASWYGKRFHGKKTSNGEIYDMYGMTGAHTTLPIPSYLRVTNPDNGRSVIIRINDRGPFHSNRLIDLSYAAAYKLGLINKGSGRVEIEAIDNRPETLAKSTPKNEPPIALPVSTSANAKDLATISSAPPATNAADTATSETAPGTIQSGSYVQVGAFKYENNADGLRQKLARQNLTTDGSSGSVPVTSWYNEGVYRVRLGPYSSRAAATEAAARIKQVLGAKTIVINQD
jgi:peptidoglycan lytic transglycosylase